MIIVFAFAVKRKDGGEMTEKICVFFIVVIGIVASYLGGYDYGYNRGCNNTWDSIINFFCNYDRDSKKKI